MRCCIRYTPISLVRFIVYLFIGFGRCRTFFVFFQSFKKNRIFRWEVKGVVQNSVLNFGFTFMYTVLHFSPDQIFRLYYGRDPPAANRRPDDGARMIEQKIESSGSNGTTFGGGVKPTIVVDASVVPK